MITVEVANDQASTSSQSPTEHNIRTVARAVLKAKRIAVVCGAGISVASGIPAFRTQGGLFETLKKQHPEAKLSSGKDLFDASLFVSEQNTALYYTMVACLWEMSLAARPTAFHSWLKSLDDQEKLLRVYTQNIDGLEQRAGLSFGLGDTTTPKSNKKRKRPEPPRCIPLHGQLATMTCTSCGNTVDTKEHLETLKGGSTIVCPKCSTADSARAVAGVRRRGMGIMKPDVVLYGEQHPHGEIVGEITHNDLMGKRPDLLLVVGTSLKVPGTKKLVKELAKVIKPHWIYEDAPEGGAEAVEAEPMTSQASSTTSTSSRRSAKPKLDKLHAVYVSLEFPTAGREWEETFDAFVRGDVQDFVRVIEDEKRVVAAEDAKKAADKKKRDEKKAAALALKADNKPVVVTAKKAKTSSKQKQPVIELPESKPEASELDALLAQLRESQDGPPAPAAASTSTLAQPDRYASAKQSDDAGLPSKAQLDGLLASLKSINDPSSLSTPLAPNKDMSKLSFVEALPILHKLSRDDGFMDSLDKLRDEQDEFEVRLLDERNRLARDLQRANAEQTKRKAELREWDTKAVKRWQRFRDGQNDKLASLGVPLMGKTDDELRKKKQERVMTVLLAFMEEEDNDDNSARD